MSQIGGVCRAPRAEVTGEPPRWVRRLLMVQVSRMRVFERFCKAGADIQGVKGTLGVRSSVNGWGRTSANTKKEF